MTSLPLYHMLIFVTLSLFLLLSSDAWLAPTTSFRKSPRLASLALKNSNLDVQALVANRYFQLEELEDAEAASTLVYLQDNGDLLMGQTDGPRPTQVSGQWRAESGWLELIVRRLFEAGHASKDQDWSMGEFEYTVERVYWGQVSLLSPDTHNDQVPNEHQMEETNPEKKQAPLTIVEGSIHCIDDIVGDQRVGFFNMIDTTQARESDGVVDSIV